MVPHIVKCDIYNTIADNNGCTVNVDYERPEDDLVKAETYVGVKE
jgi:hypothetical protein